MTTEAGLEIHRLLDTAFAGIDMTPETQDLKEEMRANLVARVAEFTDSGVEPAEAARRAIDELGDIRSVVDETAAVSAIMPARARHRVRPKPAYVVRTVILSLLAAGALSVAALPFFDVDLVLALPLAAVAVLAAACGVIVADALRQETTTSYPLPVRRAYGFGAATALTLAGVGMGLLCLRDLPLGWLIGAVAAVVVAVVMFAQLAATQTNRHKPWVMRMNAEYGHAGDRFSEDPAAAARFGLYTLTIWLTAFAAFVVLGFTVGWAWSWLALVVAVIVMMVVLARMLFGAHATT